MSAASDERSRDRWIRPLPDRVVNKIAAGEVIERPAAVVKELVENSLDAGADRIDIVIEKSGIKLIRIVDNGCGIPEEQVQVAFGRHATSKISGFDDLESLSSYGFRGEALPSVASVSRLRMVSRPSSQQSGTEIIFEGGVLESCQPAPGAIGTTVEAADLFYNTPARRKFLKTEATEARHISRLSTALAIGRYDVGFSLKMNGRVVFSLPTGQTLAERVATLLGGGRKFLTFSTDLGPVAIEGCIGAPDVVQNNRNGQYLFINGRYVFAPMLSHAFTAGYGELLAPGSFPVGALLLKIDPAEIDVNVHPSKTEVKMTQDRPIHDAVVTAIREALRHDGVIGDLKGGGGSDGRHRDFEEPQRSRGSHVIPGIGNQQASSRQFLDELYRPTKAAATDRTEAPLVTVNTETGEIVEPATGEVSSPPRPETAGPSSGYRLAGRFSDLYLLLQSGDDLYIVDQHTAHERVLYEETVRRIDEHTMSAQTLLFPVQVELSPEQLALFESSTEVFELSGFMVSPFGGRMVNIEAVPSLMTGKSPEKMLLSVLDDIVSLRRSGHDLLKAMAQSIACRAAVMAGDRLNDEEAVHLIDRLLQCDDKYSCPHGRPTFIKISREDLDRRFGRA